MSETKTGETKVGEHKAKEPKVTEPIVGKYKASEPKVIEPIVGKHKASEPKVIEPIVGKHKASEPKVAEPEVNESEIKGIEGLSPKEKKHLLAQLVRDRRADPKVGPWEIMAVRRGGWKAVKDILIQPVEIDLQDAGKDMTVRMWFDITESERQLEAGAKDQDSSE